MKCVVGLVGTRPVAASRIGVGGDATWVVGVEWKRYGTLSRNWRDRKGRDSTCRRGEEPE